jgi:RNA polymerase sigma-70 factor (TIGR02957 family)
MLGSVQEAEDIVQDTYLRWSKASTVESPAGWLTKVVTNLCLNELGSARARRETYVGPWLPEPVLTGGDHAQVVELRESVSMALLSLMERLTPAERAVFVLREAFGYEYGEIADILELSSGANARQILSRARKHLVDMPRFEVDKETQQRLVGRFLEAAAGGDVDGLASVLAADVVSWSDGGGKVSAARRPIEGRDRVIRYVLGIADKVGEVSFAEVNGQPALISVVDGKIQAIVVFDLVDGLITGLRTVLNPEKLAFATRQLSQN